MDLGSIFLILSLFTVTALFIIRPFFEHKAVSVSREEQKLSSLLAERDRILTALEELDFDFTMGKIPEEDYPAQRTLLLKKGTDILRELDQVAGPQSAPANKKARPRLEAAPAGENTAPAADEASGGIVNGSSRPAEDDDLEALIASRRRVRQEKASGFCPQCGGPLQKSDQFCPKCGTPLHT
jgi:hypothetical protein